MTATSTSPRSPWTSRSRSVPCRTPAGPHGGIAEDGLDERRRQPGHRPGGELDSGRHRQRPGSARIGESRPEAPPAPAPRTAERRRPWRPAAVRAHRSAGPTIAARLDERPALQQRPPAPSRTDPSQTSARPVRRVRTNGWRSGGHGDHRQREDRHQRQLGHRRLVPPVRPGRADGEGAASSTSSRPAPPPGRLSGRRQAHRAASGPRARPGRSRRGPRQAASAAGRRRRQPRPPPQ